ncbi:hypothetical protein [Fulvivirga sp.]|uniref:hypothetical protein n=1 Tax=Fulvivirga sp. TaxID=1931237 RepID=UPI0032EFA666
MRQLFTSLFIFLSLISLAGNGDTEREHPNSQKLATDIYMAYQFYKDKDIEACKSVMEDLNLKTVKSVIHKVSKSTAVDSLVFENNQDMFWAYLKSVDLNYLRDIEAVFAIRVEDAQGLLMAFSELLKADLKEIMTETTNEIHYKNSQGGYVIDTRFRTPSKSYISNLYDYKLILLDEYVIFEFKETVPEIFEPGQKPSKHQPLAEN